MRVLSRLINGCPEAHPVGIQWHGPCSEVSWRIRQAANLANAPLRHGAALADGAIERLIMHSQFRTNPSPRSGIVPNQQSFCAEHKYGVLMMLGINAILCTAMAAITVKLMSPEYRTPTLRENVASSRVLSAVIETR
jgi:hypothetical protein